MAKNVFPAQIPYTTCNQEFALIAQQSRNIIKLQINVKKSHTFIQT